MRVNLLSLAALAPGVLAAPKPALDSRTIYRPSADPNVDRSSLQNLSPTWEPVLFGQAPSGRNLSVVFSMTTPAVVLENSARVTYACTSDKVTLTFDSDDARDQAKDWPEGIVFITNTKGCNPADERGVYKTSAAVFDSDALKAEFAATRSEWKDVATTLNIAFTGDASSPKISDAEIMKRVQISHDKRASSCTTYKAASPKGKICGTRGDLAEPKKLEYRVAAKTFDACRAAAYSDTKYKAFSFASAYCILSSLTLEEQKWTKDAQSHAPWYDTACYVCGDATSASQGSTTSTSAVSQSLTASQSTTQGPETVPTGDDFHLSFNPSATTMNAQEQKVYDKILAGVKTNSDGVIIGTLTPVSSGLPEPTFNLEDRSQQAKLEDELQANGLPSFEDMFKAADAALSKAFDNGADATATASASESTAGAESEKRTLQTDILDKRNSLAKRYSFGEFLGDVNDYGCNDIVTSLSETADGICNTIGAGQAIYCLATGCYKQGEGPPPPPPSTLYTYTYSWHISFGGYSKAKRIWGDSATGTYLGCQNCGMQISSIQYQGTIQVTIATQEIAVSTVTLTESYKADLIMDLHTIKATTGTWSNILYTQDLEHIEQTGVFSITPRVLYGIGAKWTTDRAVDITAGASTSIDNANSFLDLLHGTAGNANGWQPAANVVQPSNTNGAIFSFTPFQMHSIQLSCTIFGRTLQDSASITSQTNLGFSTTLINLGNAAKAVCPAGQLQTTSFMDSTNAVYLSGKNVPIYNKNTAFAPKCEDAVVRPPTDDEVKALREAQGGSEYCTEFIGYVAPTKTEYSTAKVTRKSTITVTTKTKTIVLPVSTVTTTVFAKGKRDLAAGPGPATATATASTTTAPSLRARGVPMPTILSSWYPQQVSAACSSIATGTSTTTVKTISTVFSGSTTKTITPMRTMPQVIRTVTKTMTGPSSTPTNVVQNTFFGASDPERPSFNEAPPHWTFAGTFFSADCTSRYAMFDEPMCGSYEGQSIVYTLLSQEDWFDAHWGTVSQTVTNLEPGWTYRFAIQAGFYTSVSTCIVTFSLDDKPFKEFKPTNTYDSSINQVLMPLMGPYDVKATKTEHKITFGMSCPNAGNNGGVSYWTNATLWGPYV